MTRIWAVVSKFPILPEALLLVPMPFSEPGSLHFMQRLQNHCHSVPSFLPVISETPIFWSRFLLCWLSAQLQVQKEKYELKITYFFLNMRKRRKRNHLSSANKHIGNFKKTTLAPQQLSSAVCKVAWGTGMATFQRKRDLRCPTGVWSHCMHDPGP